MGHIGVVRALLSTGAMVNLQTKAGVSPLHVACGMLLVACHSGSIEVVRALLSAGARADLSRPELDLLHRSHMKVSYYITLCGA